MMSPLFKTATMIVFAVMLYGCKEDVSEKVKAEIDNKIMQKDTTLLILQQPENGYFDKVLTDYRNHSYFLSITISDKDTLKEIIIENDDLFFFLYKEYNYANLAEYKSLLLSCLTEMKPLIVNNSIPDEFILYNNSRIEKDKLKGKKYFIDKYFENRVIKKRYDIHGPDKYLIKILFDWKILVFVNDITGHLMIRDFSE